MMQNHQKLDAAKCPSRGEQANRMRSIHVAEYYSAPKRKEILSHATIGMDFEDLLGEISQTQKDKYCIIPLLRVF